MGEGRLDLDTEQEVAAMFSILADGVFRSGTPVVATFAPAGEYVMRFAPADKVEWVHIGGAVWEMRRRATCVPLLH